MKLRCAAYHEAGHMVIAAAKELRLRQEGLSVDPRGQGIACYCKQPGGSDILRKSVVVATFAGFYAERQFCKEYAYPQAQDDWFFRSADGYEARKLVSEISIENLTHRSIPATYNELQNQSEQLVDHHWLAINSVSAALLCKNWEFLRPLKSGARWSLETIAKYLSGDEVVSILGRYGIAALCAPNS